MKRPVLFLALIAISFFACKYEDGPAVSILTKKQRLDGKWGLVLVRNNDIDVTQNYPEDHGYVFDKNGSYKKISNEVEVIGNWEFNSDKSEILLTEENSPKSFSYKILRLTNKHLWLKQTITQGDHTDIIEEHYEAKKK